MEKVSIVKSPTNHPLPLFEQADFFNYFYMSILSSHSLMDFEINLFTFMSQVFKQSTCLFYSNVNQSSVDQEEHSQHLFLQRDSYSKHISNSLLRKTFPTELLMMPDSNSACGAQSPTWQEPPSPSALLKNFFSVFDSRHKFPFIAQFQTHADYIRCGMLLRSTQGLHGLLLYERPLSHPYLNSPFRMQQFQEFLSLALMHRVTVRYATLDQLTLLHRKYYFLNLAEKQLSSHPSKLYQILIIDIDFFKIFNDTYGHLQGDYCLRAIAKAIKISVRTRDETGRFGGEEFICLVQSDLAQSLVIAARIHSTISRIKLKNSEGDLIQAPTVSIGIASFHTEDTLNAVIERADKALYRAKQNGRNQTIADHS